MALTDDRDAPLTDCDTYAASEADPQHKAKGVPYDKIDIAPATPSCESAAKKYPNSSRIAFQLGRTYNKANNFKAAISQYRRAADLGHTAAKFNLGLMYAEGQGVAKDNAQAVTWYQMAAEQGFLIAQKKLGGMYYLGEGVPQDYAAALKWYRMAAESGDSEVQNNLGAIFDNGFGVKQDYAEALKYYRKAADRGSAVAQHNLGAMYFQGKGVPQSNAEALKWYRKGADQGNVKGQASVGFMYYSGHGVSRNRDEAIKWFRLAADQGDLLAQKNLGSIYYSGEGPLQNYVEAMKWLRKAADRGDGYSQNISGAMYEDGQGVAQDYAEAMKWYRKAADQGEALADNNVALLCLRAPALRCETPKQVAAAKDANPNNTPSPMPEAEKAFIAAVEKARAAYAAGANEMAQGAARPARAKEICAALKNPQVTGWIGEVETLSSNSDGLGVLAIRVTKDLLIKTWNNAVSDASHKTLIDPESSVFKKAVVLKKGQKIKFAGQFILDGTDCFREGSLTLKGSLTQPEFIFRFSDLVAME